MKSKVLTLTTLFAAAALNTLMAASLGTTINYQGRLTSGGGGATGLYDMRFRLYNDPTAGSQVGVTVTVAPLQVTSGLFSAPLDFGSGVFDGTAYWLEIGVRPNGSASAYTVLTPRQPLNAVAHSLWAVNAGTASTASGVAVNAVSASGIQNNSITSGKIAAGQVVKSLNGLFDNVTLAAGAGVSLTPSGGNTLTVGLTGGGSWSLTGNAGTTAGVNFLGTTDNQPLDLYANYTRGLRLQYYGRSSSDPLFIFNSWGINVIGGLDVNFVGSDVIGATIAGGGVGSGSFFSPSFSSNSVTADFGSIGGGTGNLVSGIYGTVPGGRNNAALGRYSFAAGRRARANADGIFVWADSQNADFNSLRADEFAIRAAGGVYLQSDAGIRLNAADTPMLSRGWDPFDAGTGAKEGHGRWGLFMEFGQIVLGMPDTDVPGGERSVAVGRYHRDGSYDVMMSLRNTDGQVSFAGNFAVVNGAGGEQAYLGGDGVGSDVQIGSFNPSVQNLAAYNPATGYMNMIVRTLSITGGSDLAEPFQMSEDEIPKGSVVVIDEASPGHLRLSTQAYDTRVAGVVSGANGVQPGIQMKQKGVLEGTENIALSGRVYVRADASLGAIKPGDLLTTSSTPGHAMKVGDPARAQGAILGKAMSALLEGKGMVLVLVTLQ